MTIRIRHAQRFLRGEDALNRFVGFGRTVHGCHQYRPPIQIEFPRGDDPHSDRAEQVHQCGQRIVREMAVPQRIPLTLRDDRDDRVVLQQQHAARGGDLGRAARRRSAGRVRA